MPQISFPLSGDSLVVPILIGFDAKAMAIIQAAGMNIPAPIQVAGELDTGCNVTAVRPSVLQHFRLAPLAQRQTTTAGGAVSVNLYEVSLSICPPPGRANPLHTVPELIVQELHHASPNIDVLIGTDMILLGSLFVDGPNKQFTIFY